MTIIYSIYKFVNQLNGKCYVGFTGNINQRLYNHKAYSKIKDNAFYRAIKKYGWESFDFTIIYQSKDREHCLRVMEPHFIKEYNSYGHTGYNTTLGGEGNSGIVSDKTKFKMSESKKGRFNAKDKDGNIFCITQDDPRFVSGKLVGMQKGIKPSPETIEKYKVRSKNNKARLGIPHSEEIKRIISERTSLALKGKPKSKVKCPHCDKIGGAGNMKRYHFDFCKLKTTPSLGRAI